MTGIKRVCVLASGSGTNLQSLMDSSKKKDSSYTVSLVISNKKNAFALTRAADESIPGLYIRYGENFESKLGDALDSYGIDLIVLAGFLKYLPKSILSRYKNRIINIHPALLPSFGGTGMYGIKVHQGVLDYGCKVTGVTIHFVNDEYDAGPVIAQAPVFVNNGDTAETLQKRVLETEHILLVQAVQALSLGILDVRGRAVSLEKPAKGIEGRYFGNSRATV